MNEIKFYYLSWEKLDKLCFELLQKIEAKKLEFDRIICISRGGLVVARIFSDFLNLPISSFTIVSYVSVGKTGKPKIMEDLKIKIKDEKVLLIDEIVDNGTTLETAVSYLKEFSPKQIISLAPIIKPWSKPRPDFWQIKTAKWVIFPYEIRETIEDLIKMWEKEKITLFKIKERLKKIGLPQDLVNYFTS